MANVEYDSDVEIIEDHITTVYISDSDSEDESYVTIVEEFLQTCRLQEEIERSKCRLEASKEPFEIDLKMIPVDIYQKALIYNIWNPTTVLLQITQKFQWSHPEFQAEDYVPTEGFLCSVKVNNRKFVSECRGHTPHSAKHFASATFLQFIGFKVNLQTMSLFTEWAHINFDKEQIRFQKTNEELLKGAKDFNRLCRSRNYWLRNSRTNYSTKHCSTTSNRHVSNSVKRMSNLYSIMSSPKKGTWKEIGKESCSLLSNGGLDLCAPLKIVTHDYSCNIENPDSVRKPSICDGSDHNGLMKRKAGSISPSHCSSYRESRRCSQRQCDMNSTVSVRYRASNRSRSLTCRSRNLSCSNISLHLTRRSQSPDRKPRNVRGKWSESSSSSSHNSNLKKLKLTNETRKSCNNSQNPTSTGPS